MAEMIIASAEGMETKDKERAPGSDKPEKTPKSAVSYGRGTRKAHCGICVHFSWPTIDESVCDGTCTLISGMIDPDRWCVKFGSGKDKKKED